MKLNAALKSAKELIGYRATIADVIGQTKTEIQTVNHQLTQARLELGREEADSALGRLAPGKAGSASANIRKLQEKLESLQARIIGLEASLSESDDEVLAAESALARELSADTEARMQAYSSEYRRAAEQFAIVLRKGKALSDATGIKFSGVESVRLYEAFDVTRIAASTTKHELKPGTMEHTEVPIRSRADEKLLEEVSSMHRVNRQLAHAANRIREVQYKQKNAQLTAANKEREQNGPQSRTIPAVFSDPAA